MRLVLCAIALAITALAPAAVASHVYSHRLVVEGRIVGSEGHPVPNATVEVTADGLRLGESCGAQDWVTDANGDFWFCFHNHELPANSTITVRAGGASDSRPVDTDLRKMVFLLVDPGQPGSPTDAWETRFRVDGRVWWRSPTTLEGVRVEGVALQGERVDVRVVGGPQEASSFDLTTDDFGDYGATFSLVDGAEPASLALHVTARGESLGGVLDPLFHRAVVDFVLPLADDEDPTTLVPGTQTPPASPALIVAAVGAGAAVWAVHARKKS